MQIVFAENGWDEYLYWQMQDKKTTKRINQLIQSIGRDGTLQGIGKPELLKLPSAEEFEASLDEAQKWAMSVGYNENDVNDIIKSVRRKKRV